ncbi:MAG: hypothetical protein ABIP61_04080 [Burkholderiaceae bacterium]
MPAIIFGRSSAGITPIAVFITISSDSTTVAANPASRPFPSVDMSNPSMD